ncbi:transcription factor GTE10-like [Wolffia australiana]
MAPTVVLERTKCKNLHKSTLAAMGRAQRFTKGPSSGFIPDYRHAVETVDESEGFVNSSHIDSENSSAPKRKCISLNADIVDGFNVPLQTFSVSLLSRSEKKALKNRLREELEHILQLQKKLFSGPVNGVAASSTTDASAKKRPDIKRGNLGQFVSEKPSQKPSISKNKTATLMKQCEQLLNRLLQHPYAWVFKQPVDAIKLNIPDYYTVIKNPMDLGTIKGKLASGAYSAPLGFASDVRLTFANAKTYNPPGNDVHIMAEALNNIFESKWKSLESKLHPLDSNAALESESVKPSQMKKRKIPPTVHVREEVLTRGPEVMQERMTSEDKQKLSSRLESLIPELPDHIIEFLKKNSGSHSQINEDEIEIDIDALGDATLFELQRLLDDFCSRRNLRKEMKPDLGEIEVLNESGVSNSSIQPRKGDEHAIDEEVDIMENDHPVTSYPPVEIEKDAAHGNSKYSSSSRSTSDSGSSSSDSDSASSSGSESLAADNNSKEATGSGPAFEHERASLADGNRHISGGLDRPEQTGDSIADADDRSQDGHAPPERQVSPEKLYRAALLRSRFADTILKAREKTLDKVEKGNPEKLQRERKELERQQQEERARLQAEARAAEDLRQQLEAKAAAEAKRKRELEREAARQALLEMEKTAEIGESGRFLKDLEMLGGVDEHLPTSMCETSPELADSDGGGDGPLGGFKFSGSNPLEKLGLYMKADEEEDETEDAAPPASGGDEVEEGEID